MGEGGLWRRVIAGQGPACIAGRGTEVEIRELRQEDWPAVREIFEQGIAGKKMHLRSNVTFFYDGLRRRLSK